MEEKMVWEIVERGAGPIADEIYVSVRKNALKMSKGFHTAADIEHSHYEYVQVKRNMEQRCILLEFFTAGVFADMKKNQEYCGGIYPLAVDGGSFDRRGVQKGGSLISCGTVIQSTPWLYHVTKEKQATSKRFKPERTNKRNVWMVRFVHIFENESDVDFRRIDPAIKGIYRFLGKDGETLYIGQGVIARRHSRQIYQKNMDAEKFQWTAIADKSLRLRAEAYHLDNYMARYGRLPKWNKLSNVQGRQPIKDIDEQLMPANAP